MRYFPDASHDKGLAALPAARLWQLARTAATLSGLLVYSNAAIGAVAVPDTKPDGLNVVQDFLRA